MTDASAPRVAVVIPAYNAEASLGAAISGALQQTTHDIEVVVVDDGSTDRTGAVAASYGDRVRLLRQENQGPAAARNAGIAAASAPLIALCDADDLLFDRHVEAMLALYDRHGGLVTANAYWLFTGGIDPQQTRHRGRFPAPSEQRQALLETNFVSTMALFSRSLWERLGGFDLAISHAEDWDFWLRAVYDGGVTVTHQPVPLALYRWNDSGLSSDTGSMDRAVQRVLAKVAARDDLTAEERRYVERRLASPSPAQLARQADEHLLAERYRQAAQGYEEASGLAPTDRVLARKARLMGLAPQLVGRALRRRDRQRHHRGHATRYRT
jgi:glycosyltransferase involved in cell wall biosynthesis